MCIYHEMIVTINLVLISHRVIIFVIRTSEAQPFWHSTPHPPSRPIRLPGVPFSYCGAINSSSPQQNPWFLPLPQPRWKTNHQNWFILPPQYFLTLSSSLYPFCVIVDYCWLNIDSPTLHAKGYFLGLSLFCSCYLSCEHSSGSLIPWATVTHRHVINKRKSGHLGGSVG